MKGRAVAAPRQSRDSPRIVIARREQARRGDPVAHVKSLLNEAALVSRRPSRDVAEHVLVYEVSRGGRIRHCSLAEFSESLNREVPTQCLSRHFALGPSGLLCQSRKRAVELFIEAYR